MQRLVYTLAERLVCILQNTSDEWDIPRLYHKKARFGGILTQFTTAFLHSDLLYFLCHGIKANICNVKHTAHTVCYIFRVNWKILLSLLRMET